MINDQINLCATLRQHCKPSTPLSLAQLIAILVVLLSWKPFLLHVLTSSPLPHIPISSF